jgi:hypothetical protein
MRKLIEATLVSLDGVVGSPEEWALPYWDEENKEYACSAAGDCACVVPGKVACSPWPRVTKVCSPVSAAPYVLRACGAMSGAAAPRRRGTRNKSVRFLIMCVINVTSLIMGRSASVVPEGKP